VIMKKTARKLALFLLLSAPFISAHSQDFAITQFELAGDKLIISYNLIDTAKGRRYTVAAYSSRDNYLSPLQKVTGDAGLEIAPGVNKKIIWNAKEEFGAEFSGRVSVEIRGRMYVPFVKLTDFADYKVRKRGVPFVVTWTGGTRQNVLHFDLYKGDTKVWTQPGVGNTGHYELTIPTNVKPGSGYRFKISDSKNKDDVVYTEVFTIKRKVPLLLKAIPVVAVGAVAYIVLKPKPEAKKGFDGAPCPGGGNDCNE
jgi:hypothetical protein